MFFSRCRHAMLAQYFDETLKPCTSNCDFCKSPKQVTEMVAQWRQAESAHLYKRISTRSRGDGGADDGELYEGGRRGFVIMLNVKITKNRENLSIDKT